MKIYYVGHAAPRSTSRQRADALERLGHQVTRFDPFEAFSGDLSGPLRSRLHYRSGYRLLQPAMFRRLTEMSEIIAAHDVIWIDGGEFLGLQGATFLSSLAPTVLMCIDDPTGGRDGRRWDSLIAALPAYDLCVTIRETTASDFRRLGARRAIKVWRPYDERAHRPPTPQEMADWDGPGGIAFIGTWMRGEGREDILLALIERGVPVSIWGGKWWRSPRWKEIQPAWRGRSLHGLDYCRAIAGADACLGFLSSGNRDLHTGRTFEIPHIGGLLVAQRTSEHVALFEEGEEALFWDDADECADQCLTVLANPERSRAIRLAGQERVRNGGFGNESTLAAILTELMGGLDRERVSRHTTGPSRPSSESAWGAASGGAASGVDRGRSRHGRRERADAMKIFYIGSAEPTSTCMHRAHALERNGHEITVFDPRAMLEGELSGPVTSRLHYRTGFRFVQSRMLAAIESRAEEIARHDVIWVDSGEHLAPRCVKRLSALAPTVMLCLDDPAGGRDGRRFDSLVAALPEYDLCVTVRDDTLADFRRLGARNAIKVTFSYDEVEHRPASAEEAASWKHGGGITFIGTWMRGEGREDILLTLIERGLPVSIWGGNWQRSPRWKAIQPAWRGAALHGRDYCRAIASADACLGFLSVGNRDQHTTRSLEIPYAGGLLVGKRTREHRELYEEGKEALFWDDADECAEQCLAVLADPERSRAIRLAGQERVRNGRFGNESTMAVILTELMAVLDRERLAA